MKKITLLLFILVFFFDGLKAQQINISRPKISKDYFDDNGRFRFAKVVETDIDFFQNATITIDSTTKTYSLLLSAEDSQSLGFFFSNFFLEDNSCLNIFNSNKSEVLATFDNSVNKPQKFLRTSQFFCDTIVLELNCIKTSSQKSFLISKIYYGFQDISEKISGIKKISTTSVCSNEVDINCDEGFDYQDIKNAVIKYSFEEDNYLYFCTGALINNYKNDSTPYVLTAAHCICQADKAETVIAYFNYEKTSCGSKESAKSKSIEGATLVATAPMTNYTPKFGKVTQVPAMDFTLLKLKTIPTEDCKPYYAGFTINKESNLETVACIHHPQGSYKKIAISKSIPYVDTYPNEADETNYELNSHWHIATWSVGTTESGSSGSPLLNSSKKIIGLLSGGYASCSEPVDDFFQMLSAAWDTYPDKSNQLKYWLAGESGITECDAYDPYNINVNYRKAEISGEINEDTTIAHLTWKTLKTSSFESDFETMETTSDINNLFLANADMDNLPSDSTNQTSSWILTQEGAIDGEKSIISFTAKTSNTNDYLTLPKITVSSYDILSFSAKSIGGNSTLKISQNTKPSRYQTFQEIVVPEETTQYNIPLKQFAGSSIYLNFNNITSASNSKALILDNIKIDKDESLFSSEPLTGYALYCNNKLVKEFSLTEPQSFDYEIEKDVSYTFYVLNLYSENASEIGNTVTFYFPTSSKTPVSEIIPQNAKTQKITLYPNPASDKLYIKSDDDFSNISIEIFDIMGKKWLSSKIDFLKSETPYEINLENFKSGVYVFKITNNSVKNIQKFMILSRK